MIILHKNNYNPKLDFLICKNLLKETPRDCDELDFKDCFSEGENRYIFMRSRL